MDYLLVSQTIRLVIGGREKQAIVAGLLQPENDLSAAHAGRSDPGGYCHGPRINRSARLAQPDRSDPARSDPQAVQRLIARLAATGYRIEPAQARAGTIQQMTEAFQLNLTLSACWRWWSGCSDL
jgi:hypothetical protein